MELKQTNKQKKTLNKKKRKNKTNKAVAKLDPGGVNLLRANVKIIG